MGGTVAHKIPRGATAPWPEVFASTSATTARVRRDVAAGRLRALGLTLYTPNLHDDLAAIVRRNAWRIVGLLAPGAVVGYRTALEARPAEDGAVFLTGAARYERDLPGLKIRVAKGPVALPDDRPFLGGLFMASEPRALLEALRPSRRRGTVARGLSAREIEARLDRAYQSGGEPALQRLRDAARALAPALDAAAEAERLAQLVAVLLGSRPGPATAPTAVARLAGEPYDPDRAALFETLYARLRQWPAAVRLAPADGPFAGAAAAFPTVSFFDAYFSNFIEGTEFEVDEARAIVFEGRIPSARPQDAHDVLGTFAVVGDAAWMTRGVTEDGTYEAFRDRLRGAHARILAGRPDRRPGLYKEIANRAGDTRFVAPALVDGTLRRGYEFARALDTPFQRAAALMFVIAEVHPFDDGNGRVARACMNAELVAGGQPRVIIPSVYRDDYLTGLRVLTRQHEPEPYLAVLAFAQRYVAAVDWSSYATAEPVLRATRAFDRPSPDVKLGLPRVDVRAAPR